MTYEQWVEATKKGISPGDDTADDAAPSINAIVNDAFSGGIEEEETQEPDRIEKPVQPPSPGPRALFKKPLGQPSLNK